ncbi:MAG: class I SAM-dependent methyltransferase [Desulfomonilaceae bacterium]
MEPYEYETLFNMETSYWWFRALHAIVRDALNRTGLPSGSRVLDAGCGTGQNLVNLMEHDGLEGFGFDISSCAASFWPRRNLSRVCVSSVNEIPFIDESFDAVVSVDVLECKAVDEVAAYSEMWRVLKSGGVLLLVVPAYDWLLSEDHHKAVGASRRYSMRHLNDLLTTKPVQVIRMTHLFSSFFPLVAGYRLLQPYFKNKDSNHPPRSDLRPLPVMLNELLFTIAKFEKIILNSFNLPFGSSILAVVRKVV